MNKYLLRKKTRDIIFWANLVSWNVKLTSLKKLNMNTFTTAK